MSGKLRRNLGALVGAFGLSLSLVVAIPAVSSVKVVSAIPPTTSPTDVTKIPHYYGPYPNWANSPQTLADAVVSISAPPATPASFGNPLIARTAASDNTVVAPATLGPVFVVLPGTTLPAGTLQSIQTWNQPDLTLPSVGQVFHAYVLRPTGIAYQYMVAYDSGLLTVPALLNPLGEIATIPVTPVAVQAGDRLGFYGQGIPVSFAIGTDIISSPAPVAPAQAGTITVGIDPGFPLLPEVRTYSFSATIDTSVTAQATATVAPTTGTISAITVTSPGSGYLAAPTVAINSPGITPTTVATTPIATLATGAIANVTVDQVGFGYTTPAVAINNTPAPTAAATAIVNGGVDNVIVPVNGGGIYTLQPFVVFGLPNPLIVGNRQATGTATFAPIAGTSNYTVTGVAVVDPGAGYSVAPKVTIYDGSITLPALPPASATATISINQINVAPGGSGYTAPTVVITDTGTGSGALATANVAVAGSVATIVVAPGAGGSGYLTPGLKKFVDTLSGLGPTAANNLGNYIPAAVPDTTTYPGTDYYEIGLVQYRQKFATSLPATLLRGYVQISTPFTRLITDPATGKLVDLQKPLTNVNLDPLLPATPVVGGYLGVDDPRYLGPTIVASKDKPVRILFRNLLPTGQAGDLFLPVDTTIMGSGMGPNAVMLDANKVPMEMTPDLGTVLDGVRNPACGETPKPSNCYSENRATLHLHGGVTPWISDGTPHQWTTPAGEATDYPTGVSVSNVPDMPDPGPGAETFFYTNQQSARLMFYHDHAWGITRLNVYAGEAAGYLVTDPIEQSLIGTGGALAGLGVGTPLIIQDKTFLPSAAQVAKVDPTWNYAKWGGEGNLWSPHVYMPAQNPADPSGASSFGRWFYGPWFWPPAKDVKFPAIANPYFVPTCDPNVQPFCEPPTIPSTPNVSVGMEAFNDTPLVNGTAYPTTTVQPTAYRYRILNAANDRFWNLSWYVADPTTGTLSEVALNPTELAAAQGDPVVFPTPDTTLSPKGPSWVQIGTEGGFLPAPVIVPAHEMTWITDPTRFDWGNADQHSLLLAPAERADVIVDFSQFRGKTLILYNDAPAAFPARVPGYDYYTGGPDMSPTGAPTTLPGFGPNTRTVMQVKVAVGTTTPVAFDIPNTTADRMGALNAAFAHHLDPVTLKPAGVFESGSDPIIVGQAAYNSALGTNFVANGWCNSPTNPTPACDGYARIQEQGAVPGSPDQFFFKFDSILKPPSTPLALKTAISFEPKGMHDETNSATFDEFGRMTANMGLEAPGATPLLQNIVLYPYVNPATEILDSTTGMPSSLKVTPISSGTDGTQIWKITHNGVDTHPIHFHLYDVQLLNRVTWDNIIIPPEPTELGWKETVRVSPLEDTIVALRPIVPTLPFGVPDSIRPLNPAMPIGAKGNVNNIKSAGQEAGFSNVNPNGTPMTVAIANILTNFGWEYVWHCHILSHEEMDMMRTVKVQVARRLAPIPVLTAVRNVPITGNQVTLTWTDGTPVDYLNPTTWTNPGSAEIGYRIERAPVLINVVGPFSVISRALANATSYLDTVDPALGYQYRVVAFNAAGDSTSTTFTVAGPLRVSTTVLTSNRNPWATPGQTVTFTATVAPAVAPAGIPGGTVQFVIDGVDAGVPQTVNRLGRTTYTVPGLVLALGSHTVTANYLGGDGIFAASSSATLTQFVKANSSTSLTSNTPSRLGVTVTFTATVTPIGVLPDNVQFTIDGVNSGVPVPLDAITGQATLVTNALTVGVHMVTAVYAGSASYVTSTGVRIQRVTP